MWHCCVAAFTVLNGSFFLALGFFVGSVDFLVISRLAPPCEDTRLKSTSRDSPDHDENSTSVRSVSSAPAVSKKLITALLGSLYYMAATATTEQSPDEALAIAVIR